jgi:hypothetical protein
MSQIQYYKLGENNYPIISAMKVEDDMIEYTVGSEPQELLDAIAAQTSKDTEAEAKQARELALASITVTTASGKVFDGRDKDRARMTEAIDASYDLISWENDRFNSIQSPTEEDIAFHEAKIKSYTETLWHMHDNTDVLVTVDELKEARALAIKAAGAIITGV